MEKGGEMSYLIVRKTKSLKGVVDAPPSKSYTHRALVIAAFADGVSRIRQPLVAADTLATKRACEIFGARILEEDDVWVVEGVGGKPELSQTLIDAGNSGTTLRFFTALSLLAGQEIVLDGDASLRKRPMRPLIDALRKLGAEASDTDGCAPVRVKRGVLGDKVEILGHVSSQFISALLLAAPLLKKHFEIQLTTLPKSRPYIEMTLQMLEEAGITVERSEDLERFKVVGGLFEPIDFRVPGDFSSAANILGAAAITESDVLVRNLDMVTKQADKKIVDILLDMGAEIEIMDGAVRVRGAQLKGIEVDAGDTPDLAPILAVLGCFATGKTKIMNIEHVRFKETDRLAATATELKKLGANITEKRDELIVDGSTRLEGGDLHGYKDHRMVMALTTAALGADGKTKIDSAETLDISYPGYVETMQKLGAKIEIID